MPGLLDFLGFGDGMPPANTGDFGAELGLLNPATLARMRMLGGQSPLATKGNPPPNIRPSPFPDLAGTPNQGPLDISAAGGPLPVSMTPGPGRSDMEWAGIPQAQPGSPAPALPAPTEVPQLQVTGTDAPPALFEQPKRAAPPPQMAQPSPSVLAKIDNFLKRNANAFLGLGAGFAGGRSIGEGIAGASRGLASGGAADLQRRSYNATVDALMTKGLSRDDAEAAAGDPHLLQAQIARLYGLPTFQQIKMPDGSTQLVMTNAAQGTVQTPTGVRGGNVVNVNNAQEAQRLPAGTLFRTPDGRLFIAGQTTGMSG